MTSPEEEDKITIVHEREIVEEEGSKNAMPISDCNWPAPDQPLSKEQHGDNESDEEGSNDVMPTPDSISPAPDQSIADQPLIEELYRNVEVPMWQEQLTFRAITAAFFLGALFTFVSMKFNLTTGIIPSLNICAGFLGYFSIIGWNGLLRKMGIIQTRFTRQENTIILACISASINIAFSGGFGTYQLAMSYTMAKQIGEKSNPSIVHEMSLGTVIEFLFTVSFVGLSYLVLLRKIMIKRFKLGYPSGTATAEIINSFHTPQGSKLAEDQLSLFGKTAFITIVWGGFQWLFTRRVGCGFKIPIFGLKAYKQKFYFDLSATYIGVGMITPYLVTLSMLLGASISWGAMWPLIAKKKGQWYSASLSEDSFYGLQGYKVFIAIAIILADGLFKIGVVLYESIKGVSKCMKKPPSDIPQPSAPYDEQRRIQFFMEDPLPTWLAIAIYISLAFLATIILPQIYVHMKCYHVLFLYTLAPFLGFCNAYGCGLTDWSLAGTYGRLVLFIIGAWAGADHGGFLVGLGGCGIITSIVSVSSDLMQDLQTGYMTLASPKALFASQVLGTAMGCVLSPLIFLLFSKAFKDIGVIGTDYSAPNALVYANMAIIATHGLGALPKYCILMCCIAFVGALTINLLRELGKKYNKRWAGFIPLPTAMAIPFYIGGYFTLAMCLGGVILCVWKWKYISESRKEVFSNIGIGLNLWRRWMDFR